MATGGAKRVQNKKATNTEVDAYVFIKNNLKLLKWDTKNPERSPTGQVWTQNECLSHPELKACLGLERPENIVKVSDSTLWVIEAKRDTKELAKAVSEAKGYAKSLNSGKAFRAKFVTGVAGNHSDGYLLASYFFNGSKFALIESNGKPLSSLLSPDIVRRVLDEGPSLADVPIDHELFLKTAETVNRVLHLGAINKDYRARVMAALLLAMVEDTPPNTDASPLVLMRDINSRAEEMLRSQNKLEFLPYVTITLPASKDNHYKFKAAIVRTIQELRNLNIRSAMNSGADVLGEFYEVFLKYGNGAKEIGIVLTPRHVTTFAVNAVTLTDRDVVYDPCCGTAGFLVAAFDYVRSHHSQKEIDRFKKYNIFGIDQEPAVVSLAVVNMIFRGDGRNNIIEGNALQKRLIEPTERRNGVAGEYVNADQQGDPVVTRVLMNPPFALKTSQEKEYKFIDHALDQMQDGGILFSVLPYGAMVRGEGYEEWRRTLLTRHTLLSVVTFAPDLFYPVGVHSVGIFIRKGRAHLDGQNVLWARAINDGLVKSKGHRRPSPKAPNDLDAILPTLRAFLVDPMIAVQPIDRFLKAAPIDMSDPLLELVPENYLGDSPLTKSQVGAGIAEVLRGAMSFLLRSPVEPS